jgi:hypothetical protein
MTVDLTDGSELDSAGIDDRTRLGWWIEGERVTVRTAHSISVYRLPKAARRITMMKLGARRSQLAIGGFTSTSVVVNGPNDTIAKLREAVL